MKAKFPDALCIFVLPPSIEELKRRLTARDQGKTHNYDVRIANATRELEEAKSFKFKVVNDDLDRAYGEFKKIVETELRTS